MLKVVIDATPVAAKPSGVGLYVTNLIACLHTLQAEENFQLGITFQPGLRQWLDRNFVLPDILRGYPHGHILPIPVRVSDLLLGSTQSLKLFSPFFQLYLERSFGDPNILHGTNYSVYPCKNTTTVLCIYDLTFIKYPKYIDSVVKTYIKRVKNCLQWTDVVLTISESSKKDIVEYLQVNPEKIYVTPLASRYHQDYLSDKDVNKLEEQVNYNFSCPYLLFVSTIEPRKNIVAIIKAFNYLKEKYKIEHNLVLIGKKGWRYEPIFNAINQSPWKNSIYHLDYLSDELVALFYSKADAFVYPSHYEGFGLPVLEAMTLGAPVISANSSSIPEVAGEAALLVNPNQTMELAEAILKVISNPLLRQELINQGKKRAKLFSWENTARKTINVYKSIM
ncbi:MAG: glycosyltransferase family 1 protein [Cyanobacteria bacterium J06639_18]